MLPFLTVPSPDGRVVRVKRPSNKTLALAVLAAGVGAGVAATRRRRRRRDFDRSDGRSPLDRLALPEGRDREIVLDDGCVIGLTEIGPHDGRAIVLIHGYIEERRVW